MYVEYESNNSGGGWWLKDDHWKKLEAAGWKVVWASLDNKYTDEGDCVRDADGTPTLVPAGIDGGIRKLSVKRDGSGEYRYMGALAKRAYRVGMNLRAAVDDWERATGESATEAGCPCCGQPHNFTEYDDAGKYVASGPSIRYEAYW